jgi:hypothetical protein
VRFTVWGAALMRWDPPAMDVAVTASPARTTAMRAAKERMWPMLAHPFEGRKALYITGW